jgi:hypothetical protein
MPASRVVERRHHTGHDPKEEHRAGSPREAISGTRMFSVGGWAAQALFAEVELQ